MDDKILQFPISYSERHKNLMGPLCVECQVSGRYLRFHEDSSTLEAGEFITVDVMAMPSEEAHKSREICQLVITREDLLEALKHISPKI